MWMDSREISLFFSAVLLLSYFFYFNVSKGGRERERDLTI